MEKQVFRATPGHALRDGPAGQPSGGGGAADDDPGPSPGAGLFVAMAGWLGGTALQLQQPALWPVAVYGATALAGLAGWMALALRRRRRVAGIAPLALGLLLAAMLGAGATGWRAARYAAQALDPALEGRDLRVVGVVVGLPQRGEGGTRFALAVESARWAPPPAAGEDAADAPVDRVPGRIALTWHVDAAAAAARAPPSSAGPSPGAPRASARRRG